jgi:hypothetical protein
MGMREEELSGATSVWSKLADLSLSTTRLLWGKAIKLSRD